MRIFDLHCDTLYECAGKNKSLLNGELEINIEKGKKRQNIGFSALPFGFPTRFGAKTPLGFLRNAAKCLKQAD